MYNESSLLIRTEEKWVTRLKHGRKSLENDQCEELLSKNILYGN